MPGKRRSSTTQSYGFSCSVCSAISADATVVVWTSPSPISSVIADDRCCRGLDDVDQSGLGIPVAQRANQRRGEDHIADEAQPDEQNRQRPVAGASASSISITGIPSFTG
jgi:hypothetical protein